MRVFVVSEHVDYSHGSVSCVFATRDAAKEWAEAQFKSIAWHEDADGGLLGTVMGRAESASYTDEVRIEPFEVEP